MTAAEKSKVSKLVPPLLVWFAAHARDLPWRRTHDPYAIWVSEIMLQQTQVKTVISFWNRWMRELPTIQAAAEVDSAKLHKLWEGLGYYTRVRNLQKAAQVIVAEHGGKFPENFEDVLALPGIGRYTAGAVCSIAFNQPTPILDGNVIRVLTRVFGIAENPKEKATNARLWQLAEALVTHAKSQGSQSKKLPSFAVLAALRENNSCSFLNQSLMELGALVCTPRTPQCLTCPIQKFCVAFKESRTEELPNLDKREAATARRFFAFVIEADGKFLVQQRPAGVVNAHLWEFPNVEVGERTAEPAEVLAELNLLPANAILNAPLKPLSTVKHSITRYRITLEAFAVSLKTSPGKTVGVWKTPTQMRALAFTSAHKKVLAAIATMCSIKNSRQSAALIYHCRPMINFDYNATAPVMREAREAWLAITEKTGGNPSSMHQAGSRASNVLADAREKLAAYLGCHPLDIIWTSGATEANNMVTHHFSKTLGEKDEVWISAIEHPCVHDSAKHYFGKRAKMIPVTRDGAVDVDWLTTELADARPGLVAVMTANNETGVIQPWREIHAICKAYGVPFFTDAVQFIGKMPLKGLGEIDYVSGAAHKFGGPRGVGFLKIPHRKSITPLLHGGKQEGGRRAGTENVAIIAAMMAALDVREKQISHSQHLLRGVWRDNFERELLRALPGTTIIGANVPRLWNTVSALMPEGDRRHQWVIRLDKAGFAASTGSACTTGKEEPSHVLAAMGYKSAHALRAVRFSAGWETNEADWEALVKGVAKVHVEMQAKV